MGICSGTSTEWLFVHYSRSNWNLAVLIFAEGGKPENPEKNPRSEDENQQQTQPTYDAGSGNRTRATLVGGECSHHCAIPAPLERTDLKSENIGLLAEEEWLKEPFLFYFRPSQRLFLKPIKRIDSAAELSRVTRLVKLSQKGTKI